MARATKLPFLDRCHNYEKTMPAFTHLIAHRWQPPADPPSVIESYVVLAAIGNVGVVRTYSSRDDALAQARWWAAQGYETRIIGMIPWFDGLWDRVERVVVAG